MISQVLNRGFILEQLKDVKAEIEQQATGGAPRRGADHVPDGAANLTTEDYRVALEEVTKSIQKEARKSSGQLEFDEPEDQRQRGQPAALMDDFSFFSRDHVISNLQSALDEYFETQQSGTMAAAAPETTERSESGGTPAAAEYSLEHAEPRRELDGRRVFDPFSVTDPRWISCALAMGIRWYTNKHDFVARPATPMPIADRARVLMVGDWGSGLPRARNVAVQMRKILDQGITSGLQQHVIHLGDVYYSGWKREVHSRFLKHWPVRLEEARDITSWSVNANHDMYSGGHGYFETLLGDPRFQRHEGSSWFSLVNRYWRILGLDTGWEEHQLKDPQPRWIREQVGEAEHAGQKAMLLSHHQPFSAFENEEDGKHLVAALGDLLKSPKIDSWFWGHEHRCAVYREYMNIRHGRLLGHGGVPVYQWKTDDDPIPEPAVYEYRGRFREGLEQWARFGFAVLDFDGPSIEVRYINELGVPHYKETIR